jgi:carboxymethylenebutenolidase
MRVMMGVLAAVLLLGPGLALAADVKGEEITFSSGDEKIKGWLVVPEGKGPFPGIVVIQEWWGLTDWIKENATHLAKQGYVCLAPDLYRGKVATDFATARKLRGGMPNDRALRDLKGAVDVLAKNDKVDKTRIGAIGWCMGGGLALNLALADKRVKACAICYGAVVTDPAKLEPLAATILGIFGKEDKGIPIENVRKFAKALEKAGKRVEGIHEYEAGHGFMRPGKENKAYVAKEAKAAWAEIDKFFAKALSAFVRPRKR